MDENWIRQKAKSILSRGGLSVVVALLLSLPLMSPALAASNSGQTADMSFYGYVSPTVVTSSNNILEDYKSASLTGSASNVCDNGSGQPVFFADSTPYYKGVNVDLGGASNVNEYSYATDYWESSLSIGDRIIDVDLDGALYQTFDYTFNPVTPGRSVTITHYYTLLYNGGGGCQTQSQSFSYNVSTN